MSPSASGRRGRLAALVALALAALAAGLLASRLPRARVAAAVRAWERELGPFESFARADARVAGNEAAAIVDELASRLDEHLPDAPSREAVDDALRDWVDAQAFSGLDVVDPPPTVVALWLEAHDVTLEAVMLQLYEGEAPRWESATGEVEKVLATRRVHALQLALLAGALERLSDGHPVAARALLEASWRLGADLRERTDRLAQASSSATLCRQAAILRKLPFVPDSWDGRLDGAEVRARTDAILRREAWQALKIAQSDDPRREMEHPEASPLSRVPGPFGAAAWRLQLADGADRARAALSGPPPPCLSSEAALAAAARAAAPWWNESRASFELRSVARARDAAVRTALELELTRVSVAARRAILAGAEVPGELPCEACPDRTWRVTRDELGFRVALSATAADEDRKGGTPGLAHAATVAMPEAPR